MTDRDQLEKAINLLEAQRDVLGDAVVETALTPLRAKLTSLNKHTNGTFVEPRYSVSPSLPTFDGERRVVTILFCDVVSSTTIAEELDPEEWAQTIQRALEYIMQPVYLHGGMIAEVRGDGILAFFGAPLAHEDDPQRGVLAALEMIEGIRLFQEQLQHERSLEVNVRVGIHTGLVVVGEVGRRQQGEYTAFGDAVNLAARMEQTALPGTVQISEQTHKLVEHAFDCEPLEEIRVKGKRQPVQTYQVLGLRTESARRHGLGLQALHSPLVGRKAEFVVGKESLDRLLGGQGSILHIFGEAGIGKSRLIEEIHQGFPKDRLCWLEGHNLSYGSSIPYWPFQEILRGYVGISDQDDEDLAWDKLESQITVLFPENVAEILPYLASLLAVPVSYDYFERVKYLDGEALGRQIFLASWRFFERLASIRPVVLVFEDLQWMDASSVSLLEHLLPLVEQVPLSITFLSRSLWQTPATPLLEFIKSRYLAHYIAIRLMPLSQSESAQLVHKLLEIEELPIELYNVILSKAEGNPFFLEELLRALIDLGVIQREGTSGRWRPVAQMESPIIPDTLQRVILARLDRLEEDVKRVLRVASVIGRNFLYRVLRAVARDEMRLDEHLIQLQTLEIIQEKKHTIELEYSFKHALAREVIYENLLLDKRRELHAQVGMSIETLFPDRLEELYGLLAYHYAKAEVWEKAHAYLLRAADQASQLAADSEALENYRQALAVSAHALDEEWDPLQRATLERKMGEALSRRGEWAQAFEFLRSALVYLERPLPRSRSTVRLTLILEVIRHIGHSLVPAIFRKQQPSPAAEEVVHIYQALEVLVAIRDPEFFLLLAFRMSNFCHENSLPIGVAQASTGLGIIFGEFLNLPRLGKHYLHQAVILAEQLQRLDALGLPYAALMTLMAMIGGEWEAALEYGQRSAEALRKIGNLGEYSISIFIASTIAIWRGDFAHALADGQEQAQLGRQAGEPRMIVSGLWVQGFAEQCLGRLEAAITHLKQALEIAESSGNVYLRVLTANQLAWCYLCQGQWRVALDRLESNENLIVEYNFKRAPFPNAMLRNGLAATYLLAAEQSDTQERNAWLNKAERACRDALRWNNSLRPGKPEALRIQGRYEWLKGNARQAQHWWRKSLAEAEALGMPYELGLTHLEIGKRLGKRAHLQNAEAIFTRIGLERDLPVKKETQENE